MLATSEETATPNQPVGGHQLEDAALGHELSPADIPQIAPEPQPVPEPEAKPSAIDEPSQDVSMPEQHQSPETSNEPNDRPDKSWVTPDNAYGPVRARHRLSTKSEPSTLYRPHPMRQEVCGDHA